MISESVGATNTRAAAIGDAIAAGTIGERVWFYSNYTCNLACRYCLTSSSPSVPARELDGATMVALARDAVRLGFRSFGITGGEPLLRRDMPELIEALATLLPVVVLTNGTLLTERFVRERLVPLRSLPVAYQISIDAADAALDDLNRGEGTHARALAGLEHLATYGLGRRVGTTIDHDDSPDLAELRLLALANGVAGDDHVVRPIIARGAASTLGIGAEAGAGDVPPELTITVDGAFWSPASPTIRGGRLDLAERLTQTIRPLDVAAEAMLRFAQTIPQRTFRVT